jgi:pimeloyl-ACP methyl ester carboxylesterase
VLPHATVACAALALLPLVGPPKPSFAPRPCAAGLEGFLARCGVVEVPESREGGRTIALNVVVIPAATGSPHEAPIFHLEGGPGLAGTGAAPFYAESPYHRSHDVVLFDMRGTGASHPLRCPALERRSSLEDMYPEAEVSACVRELEGQADLTAYTTERAADDVDQVRQALGYETIDLWAVSYGTRLAQEYLRRFGGHVARSVLVGFVPVDYRPPLFHATNAQRVLDLVFHKCQTDAACSARYPRLRADWETLRDALKRGVVVRRGTEQSSLREGPFLEAVRTMMGTAAGQRRLPALIHAAAAGDFAPFLERLPKDSAQFAEGLYLAISCSEGAARIQLEDVERYTTGTFLGDYRVRQERQACALWPLASPSAASFEPLTSAAPVMVLSGEMDHVAAPDWGQRFCAALPSCRFVSVPDMGHGPFDLDVWTGGACFDQVAASFLDDPATVDLSCLKAMHPPAFQ